MKDETRVLIESRVRQFRLPKYDEIPDVGLYLDQAVRYVSDFTQILESISITGSMVSNYVKKGLIENPVRKLYYRDQIAYIIFIAIAKTVLSLEDLQLFIALQKRTYSAKVAYDYFCAELENILYFIFGLKEHIEEVGREHTDEKVMLRNTVITVAHKIFLDQCFEALHNEEQLRLEEKR